MLVVQAANKFIDLDSISSNTDISLKTLLNINSVKINRENIKDVKFSFDEVEVADASSSIYYTQHSNKILISIYGPKECKIRDKTKSDEAIVEVYTKFNYEINKESILIIKFIEVKKLNGMIQNFCESLIFLESFPRCQINVCINIISFDNEDLVRHILNKF